MKKLLSYGVSVIITIAALWYLLKGITSEEWTLIGQDFGNLNWLYVALGVVVSLLSHVVRAERYRTIMRPLYPDLRFISSFNAVMIGYAFNTILPRAGEVVRPLVFARRESIRTEEAIGGVLIERILDVVSIIVALLLVVVLSGDTVAGIFNYYSANSGAQPIKTEAVLQNLTMILAVLLAVVALIVFTTVGQTISERVIGRIHKPLGDKLSLLITRFSSALAVIKEPRLYVRLIIESTLVWAIYCFVAWFLIMAMPYGVAQTVTLAQASIILVVIGIAVTVAPTPGALGIYQITAQAALVTVCGATMTQGLVFGMISWFVNYGLVLLGGGICWLLESRDRVFPSSLNSTQS
jgi:uncharacterized protein (TIRG00374 family)